MSFPSVLKRNTIQYLNEQISLSQFESWLASKMADILSLKAGKSRDLVGEIQLSLSEISLGNRTEEELKAELSEILETSKSDITADTPFISTGLITLEFSEFDVDIPTNEPEYTYETIQI